MRSLDSDNAISSEMFRIAERIVDLFYCLLKIPNRTPRIVCIRVQWNHTDLLGWGAGGVNRLP